MAVDVQQIEGEIGKPIRLSPGDRVLKVANMGNPALIGHRDFAVEDDLALVGQQIAKWRAEDRRPVIPVPGDQLQRASPVEYGDDPVAVIFDLMQPIVAF